MSNPRRRTRRRRDREGRSVIRTIWHLVLCSEWEMWHTSSLLAFMSASSASSSFFFVSFFFDVLLSMFAIAQSSSSIFAFSICMSQNSTTLNTSNQSPTYPRFRCQSIFMEPEYILWRIYWTTQPIAASRTDLDTKKLALPSFVVLYPFKVSVGMRTAFQYKANYIFEKSNLVWILAS